MPAGVALFLSSWRQPCFAGFVSRSVLFCQVWLYLYVAWLLAKFAPARVHSSSETNHVRRLREGQSAKHLRPFLSSLFNTTTGGTSAKHAAGVAKRQPQRGDRTRGPDSVG